MKPERQLMSELTMFLNTIHNCWDSIQYDNNNYNDCNNLKGRNYLFCTYINSFNSSWKIKVDL